MFQYLTPEQRQAFVDGCLLQSFSEGEKIIEEGAESTTFYTVLDGAVNISVSERTGKDVFICMLGEGDFFGEAALFLNTKRTAHATATEGTRILSIERDSFMAFLKEHPGAGIKLLMLIIYSLLAKLREANQELAFERKASISQSDVDNILSSYLNS